MKGTFCSLFRTIPLIALERSTVQVYFYACIVVERNQIAVSMSLCEAVVALVMTNINQVGDSMTVRWVSINITQLKMQLRLACFV